MPLSSRRLVGDRGAHARASHWLADAGDLTPRAPLPGDRDVDVAVLGGGYTGLWTAAELLRRDPRRRVAVVEAEIAGWGASGRNGGWCTATLGLSAGELARRHGAGTARKVAAVMRDAVDAVGRVCEAQGIDAQFRRCGILRIARGISELAVLRAAHRSRVELDLDDGVEMLSAAELGERVRVSRAQAAMFDPAGATIHPGRLARGLAELVERRGGTVWEQTRVTAVEPGRGGRRPRLRTTRGTVTADAVVLAGEAYLARLPGLRRLVLPVYSLIVLTEPLSPAQWAAIGWRGGEVLSSQRLTVDYLSRTADGRILFGGRGAPYHYGSRIEPGYDRHPATHAMLRRSLAGWFPAAFPTTADVPLAAAWGGPLAIPRDWTPSFRFDPRTGVAAAHGYTGQGVAAANLAGRVLADLIDGEGDRWEGLPMVGHRPRRWEPEPVRWLAVRALQRGAARVDARAERTGRARTGRTLTERLLRH